MRVGLYTVLSLLFIIAVAVGTYLINPGTFGFEVFGINLPKLPIAAWVAMPVAVLVIFSILHMVYYSTKNFFSVRKLKGDAKKLEDGIYWSLIGEPTSVKYTNSDMTKAASILAASNLVPNEGDLSNVSDKIKEAAKIISKINSGEYVDLKKEKFAKHLSDNNPIKEKNDINHLNSDSAFALKVIDFRDKYSQNIVDKALDKLVESEDAYTLKKYAKDIGKDRFFKLLSRANSGEDIGLNQNLLKDFISNYELNCKDYYHIAKFALKSYEPDNNLKLFKELSSSNDKATAAYIYLLFKYEMLDKVKDILDESANDELKALKGFYSLKKGKYNYKIDDIIGEDTICKWV